MAVLCSAAAAAQGVTTATLSGRVTDPAGALVAGAEVIAVQAGTGQVQRAFTDREGRFRLSFLPVGGYRLQVTATGFAMVERPLQLGVGASFDVSVALGLAQTASSATVIADAPVVETDRTEIAETVSRTEARDLPFNGRNYLDLALLLPGVSPTNTANTQTFAESSPVIGQGYSVNSQRNFSNSFIVDGLSANDDAAGLAGNSYGLDVVREFQVVTSGGQAEFGRALGGYINIVTESGTNDLHGGVYGFLRNQRLNANSALSGTRLPLTQGQYGATLGGPVRRGRAFFFTNFEQRHLNTDGVITIAPTAASAINARLLTAGYRAPLLPVSAGGVTLYPTTVHTNNFFLRGDAQLSARDTATLRYSLYTLNSLNARGAGGLNAMSYGTGLTDTNNTVALGNVLTLSPHVVNETRAQWTRDDLSAPPNDSIGPNVIISGVATFGRFSTSPVARNNDLFEVVDNVVDARGAHTVKAGVDFLLNHDTFDQPQYLRGGYVFASLASFLAGTYNTQGFLQTIGIGGSSAVTQNNPNAGMYLQDEWKIGPRLTLNAGLRYDLQFLQTVSTATTNVSPRAGFAWSPTPDGRTVVRSSFGLFYDRVPLRGLANALLSAENTIDPARLRLLSYTFSPGQPGAPRFPGVASAPPVGVPVSYTVFDRHIQNAVAEEASLELEQQIGPGASFAISYQHVRGLHLGTTVNNNINPDGSRPNPSIGNLRAYESNADSYYDGLAVSVVQRPTRWASARLSYTWSKAIDDIGEFFFSAPSNNFFPGEDRGRSDDDQRHRLVMDATLRTPLVDGGHARERVWRGWQMGGILQWYSAPPFNVVTGTTTRQGTVQRPCLPAYTLLGINPCTEALPGSTIRRNTGTGFASVTLSARLSRSFALHERLQLETIAEAFNALNHRNNLIPNATFGTGVFPSRPAPSFGQPTAVADPRSVQLAARLRF